MILSNKIPYDRIRKALEALSKDDEAPVKALYIPEIFIQDIRRIMNIYAMNCPNVIQKTISEILSTHAPHAGFLRLERFLKASGKDWEVPDVSVNIPRFLAGIFATSAALSLRLNSDRSLIEMLGRLDAPDLPHFEKDYYYSQIGKFYSEGDLLVERIKALHRGHTVHLMRICARNSDQQTPISEISAELSALAEAVIEICLEFAAEEMFARTGITGRPNALTVLGLGKLGGYELNVSSDIDLIYLCPDQDTIWGNYDPVTFHTMLAERLTRLLTEATAQSALYRVDTRLRADGLSGPLVRTTGDYFRYLELRGEGWERQMLLKARPVAGDYTVAERFLKSVERFVFPATISRSPNREIVALKKQIEARFVSEGSKKTHIKLMEGGIRDIEFIVQCLQLLMGGIHPEVRETGTLAALDRLREFNAVDEKEHSILSEAYAFYRKVENALQWRELLPVFSLPDKSDELEELELFLGLEVDENQPGKNLSGEIESRRKDVRAIYNEIFSAEGYGSFEEMTLYTAIAPDGDEKVSRFLENLGFGDPDESERNIAGLAFEKAPGVSGSTIHPSAERFLPVLLRKLAELPDPSGALERFRRVAESYKARYTLFDILGGNETFFDLLMAITHGSIFITDIIINDPSLLDWLFETGEILHPLKKKGLKQEINRVDSECGDDSSFTKSCLTAKNREKLRIGSRDITGLSSTTETFSELTSVAETIVKTTYKRSFRELSASYPVLRSDYEFAVVAAGRLGADTMNFGSDLDLIFVYRAGRKNEDCIEISEYSIKLAMRILALITGGGGSDKVYDVDVRLRPEGGNAVLAISLESYKTYIERRASVWERLAHVRTRFVAGSPSLGREIMELLHGFVYRGPFSPGEIESIRENRASMVESSLKRYPGLVNIKSGPGGIADIDFIAQSYAAHYGSDSPELRKRDTCAILNALGKERIIDRNDVSTLIELYTFLNDAEKVIRISSGKAVNTIPASGVELMRVARLLGFKNIRRFGKRLDDVRDLTRQYHERMMEELLKSAGHVNT